MSVATAIYQETCHVCVAIKNKLNAIWKRIVVYQDRRASYWMLQNLICCTNSLKPLKVLLPS